MSAESDIKKALRGIVGIDNLSTSELCRVVSVDEDEMTCEVISTDRITYTDVRLMADEVDSDKGFYLKPTVDSWVMITPQNESTYFVSMTSEVDEIWLRGNTNGGLVKVSDLVTKLNKLENDINTLKTAFTSWIVVPSDGGAALKAITSTWAGQQLTPTVANDLQSTTVKHG